jgi:hypothetical protein
MNDIKDAEAFCHRRPRAKAIRMTKASDNAGKSATKKYNNNNNRGEGCQLFDSPEISDGRSLKPTPSVQGDLSTLYKSRPRMPSQSLQSPPPTAPTRPYQQPFTTTLPRPPFPLCSTTWPNQQAITRPLLVTAPSAAVMQRPKHGIARSERPTSSR